MMIRTLFRTTHVVTMFTIIVLSAMTHHAQAIETDIVERVKDIFPGFVASDPSNLVNINGTLYFSAGDIPGNRELWKSDGTPAGTIKVKDINPAGSSSPGQLTHINGTLFFAADDGINGRELWKSDGTQAGTVMVKNIETTPGGGSFLSSLININGTLYFSADINPTATELWKSDGTPAGTVMVKDINPSGSSNLALLTNVDGTLFFRADDGMHGFELWKSDGTDAGTVIVKDINPFGNSTPSFLTDVNGTLFFKATRSVLEGDELWKSDGTEAGTVLVKNINPGIASGSNPQELINFNDTLYFRADDGTSGIELWKSDGTESGTVMVKDIASTGSSIPTQPTNVNGMLFFRADASGTNMDRELWKTDGTKVGTIMVRNINPNSGSGSNPGSFTNVNNTLYFSAFDGANGRELWKSDGTTAGTVMVQNINSDPNVNSGGSFPSWLTNLNGVLYFTADDAVTGYELYRAYVRTDTPPVFDDVPVSHPFYNAITNFALSGYTSGCSVTPSLYCPNDPVTRAQMAVFINRGVNGQDFVPEPATGNVFNDVPIGSFAAAWIETFKELKITGGCSVNPPLYCPNDLITRSQMAVFLLRVIHGSAYTPPTATGTAFADVNIGDFAIAWIEQLAKENITGGCGNNNFCPNDPVTRGQMAAFLTRVFHTPQLFE